MLFSKSYLSFFYTITYWIRLLFRTPMGSQNQYDTNQLLSFFFDLLWCRFFSFYIFHSRSVTWHWPKCPARNIQISLTFLFFPHSSMHCPIKLWQFYFKLSWFSLPAFMSFRQLLQFLLSFSLVDILFCMFLFVLFPYK
jgi:hypothetical protein